MRPPSKGAASPMLSSPVFLFVDAGFGTRSHIRPLLAQNSHVSASSHACFAAWQFVHAHFTFLLRLADGALGSKGWPRVCIFSCLFRINNRPNVLLQDMHLSLFFASRILSEEHEKDHL